MFADKIAYARSLPPWQLTLGVVTATAISGYLVYPRVTLTTERRVVGVGNRWFHKERVTVHSYSEEPGASNTIYYCRLWSRMHKYDVMSPLKVLVSAPLATKELCTVVLEGQLHRRCHKWKPRQHYNTNLAEHVAQEWLDQRLRTLSSDVITAAADPRELLLPSDALEQIGSRTAPHVVLRKLDVSWATIGDNIIVRPHR